MATGDQAGVTRSGEAWTNKGQEPQARRVALQIDFPQPSAIDERPAFNAGDGIWNRDRMQGGAAGERFVAMVVTPLGMVLTPIQNA